MAASPRPIATDDLVDAASALAPSLDSAGRPRLEQFASLYLDWILAQRGMSRETSSRRERTSFMLHALVGAPSLGDALDLYARFAPMLWGDCWLSRVDRTEDQASLTFTTPAKPGLTGLVDDLWNLARAVSELEWLVEGEVVGAYGQVRRQALLDPAVAALFFNRPVTYGAETLSLRIPTSQLKRPVVARPETIDAFCAGLPLSTLAPAMRRHSAKSLVADVVRQRVTQGHGDALTFEAVAALLGQNPAALRRSLQAEGAGFRDIRESVFGQLAQHWLTTTDLSVEAIATRLGYSDGFAFRRWFKGRFGCAPSALRRAGP